MVDDSPGVVTRQKRLLFIGMPPEPTTTFVVASADGSVTGVQIGPRAEPLTDGRR